MDTESMLQPRILNTNTLNEGGGEIDLGPSYPGGWGGDSKCWFSSWFSFHDCYWVGSLDFNFLGNQGVFH